MKHIIDGKPYDTLEAKQVHVVFNDHPLSDAGIELYRTREGVFFKITYDHDARVLKREILTEEEAQTHIAKHRNQMAKSAVLSPARL